MKMRNEKRRPKKKTSGTVNIGVQATWTYTLCRYDDIEITTTAENLRIREQRDFCTVVALHLKLISPAAEKLVAFLKYLPQVITRTIYILYILLRSPSLKLVILFHLLSLPVLYSILFAFVYISFATSQTVPLAKTSVLKQVILLVTNNSTIF